ncbi:hypothetical protein tinsulaeT_33770 [Thalassotalea insulae]|uniref:Solute-binding protein family 3/N-terminal domain-containing protein n=1 Tax=Thalassotalea insulae TaxID=2056778 RepID=A0ABQ6GVZ8_9GAMM|nr:transporter substrate-binding domain-containing protein [Thalassotalea insulae]GLX80037.1 hypothetical protein tinsulaeT_33770 [Thalassotalea insulae]
MKWAVCGFLLFFMTHAIAWGQDNELTIHIVAPELRPLVYQNANGQADGLFIDALSQAQQQSHLNFQVKIVPWARAMQLVKNNQVDAIMPVLYTKERAQSLVYPQAPLINFYGSVIVKRSSDSYLFHGFDKLTDTKSIAKVRAMSFGKNFNRAMKNPLITITEVAQLEDALNMLLLKRVDLVVADGLVADDIISTMSIENQVEIMAISDHKESSYLGFSQRFSEHYDVNRIMEMINQFNDPEYYQKKLTAN